MMKTTPSMFESSLRDDEEVVDLDPPPRDELNKEIFEGFSETYSHVDENESWRRIRADEDDFTMRNGCCRECMKAFSKSGKVIINHNF
jgi:hypothetical protein